MKKHIEPEKASPAPDAQYSRWLAHEGLPPDLRAELQALSPAEARMRFAGVLRFGTGGLRGLMGAGSARMNPITVGHASQALAAVLKEKAAVPRVAIAYDSRIHSLDFAERAASVLAGNGVEVLLFREMMPTPTLSFAVRHLGLTGGIVITASHNPPAYNGYKVYGQDGGQITEEAARAIMAAMDKMDPLDDVRAMPLDAALAAGIVSYIGDEVGEAFLAAIAAHSPLACAPPQGLKVVYTPLHGAGIQMVPECLKRAGFQVMIPEEQKGPDGRFPTCPSPNPEEAEALSLAIGMAKEKGAELVLGTDPDCDRVGAAVRHGGAYHLITGNQMGVLLLDFIAGQHKAMGTLPKNPIAIKTIVTAPMAERVAAHHGITLLEVLTGFKYIGEMMGRLEREGRGDGFIFGFEESYGYLGGDYVRDKDGVGGALLICQMAAAYRAQGMTLVDGLGALFRQYGHYGERLITIEAADPSIMAEGMAGLRAHPPAQLGGLPVAALRDYQADGGDGLPLADVLRLTLEDGSQVVIRPSGTEPKLKAYAFARGESKAEVAAKLDRLEGSVEPIFS